MTHPYSSVHDRTRRATGRACAAFALTAFALAAAPLAAQRAESPDASASGRPRRVATAVRTTHPPVLDGILDDEAWAAAPVADSLVQAEPFEGEPATERTEVRILYDDSFIYVAVNCLDSNPSQIVSTDSRRDANMGEMDSFQLIFDTFRDRQNGFVFGTNVAGSQYDAQVRNEGETQSTTAGPSLSGSASGTGAGVNVNWDGTWDVKSRLSDTGWAAEFRIPFRTLRYGAPPQVWGFNFTRNIRSKREQVYWSPVSRAYNLFRLSSAGELQGLQVAPPRNFKVLPYATASNSRSYAGSVRTLSDTDGAWGIDAKYGVTPSLNLDLTYNTDFAQVEADEQQINLTRFNLVFPEKRPFFLENAGLFAFGKTGQVDLFYSRRIGIGGEGQLVPVRGGARLTGKAAGANIGVLNMQTNSTAPGQVTAPYTPANNFTAVRVSRELPRRSRLGAIFTNRTAAGDSLRDDDWNRAVGVDGKLGFTEALTFNGWAARTFTPGLAAEQHAYSGGLEFNNRDRRDYVEFTEVAAGFNPEVGFLQRTGGYRQLAAGWFEHVRTPAVLNAGFRELYPHMAYQRYWKFDGTLQSASLHMDSHLDWENGYYWSPAVNIDWDRLDRPFEVYPGVTVPPGSYRAVHTAWQANTDRRKAVSANIGYFLGGFLSGHQNSMAPGITMRRGAGWIGSFTWTRNDIDLPEGAFVTNLALLRLTRNFTPNVSLQSLLQYNDRTSRWSANVRFSWLTTGSAGLFLVYNDTEALRGLGPVNRAFIVKYSRQIDILN